MKLSAFLCAAALMVGNAAAQGVQPIPVGTPIAPIGAGDSQTVYPLQVPAGISLISVPLDAGSGLAIDAILGVDGSWPLLFKWDSSTQQFLDPEDSLLSPGAGYWYYSPAPSTLLILGKPYGLLSQLTRDIPPGWHLLGVPFTEGVDWRGFRLYASGNPIGLETARNLGWISPTILTMRGSTWQVHAPGAPFVPGAAYWIRTTVPLSLRAERAGVLSAVATTPTPLPPTLKNIVKVIENKNSLVSTGQDIKAGKLATGGFSGSGAVFGLANAAVQAYRYNNIMNELNTMDDKVDELLTDVSAIQSQLAQVQDQINEFETWMKSELTLYQPLVSAEAWLAQYYTDRTQSGQSYNWARWSLAGCDVTASTCTATVTDASEELFGKQFAKFPAKNPPTLATDNIYLWWAYSVLGGQANIPPYMHAGSTAKNFVQSLHDGMVLNKGTSNNGLRAYMENVFSQSACKDDVTACDLYSQVYLPFEAYFQQLITTQVTLVQAIVESYAVLASTDQVTHSYDSWANDYLAGFAQTLSDEAEAFVQVAEQIALYRAGDGRFDWSSFSTTDASQLLARADFLAAKLVSSATGKPWPWPPGVTGRLFYTAGTVAPDTTAHKACAGSTCTTLTEVVPPELSVACSSYDAAKPNDCTIPGNWPYLQWQLQSGVAIGVPTTTWKLRRLAPQQMSEGTYQVASIMPAGGNVGLVVAQYGDDYSNPPEAGTTPVLFGSFNNLEGSIGIGSLGGNRTYSTSFKPDIASNLHAFTVTPSTTYTQMTVAYKGDHHTGTADWYESMKIKVPNHALFGAFPKVRVFWPSTIEASLGSRIAGTSCSAYYYQNLAQSLHLVQDNGNYKTGVPYSPCTITDFGFASCSVSNQNRNDNPMVAWPSVTLDHSEVYTLRAHFTDEVWGYYGSGSWLCEPYPTSGSHFTWKVFNPTITLTKN